MDLLAKDAIILWEESQKEAFVELKEQLTTAPLLVYPEEEEPFILDTDASSVSVGAVLSQMQEGQERPVPYASMRLNHNTDIV